MNTLGHIQPPIEQLEGFHFFATITLPKCHYRKGPNAQFEVAKRLFRRIAENYFDTAYACCELTQKGNVHIHSIIKLKEGYNLSNDQASARMMSAFLKPYSNCDFQVIKKITDVYAYIYKDLEIMRKVLDGKSPCISWTLKPGDILKPLVCKHNIPLSDDCPFCKILTEKLDITCKYRLIDKIGKRLDLYENTI